MNLILLTADEVKDGVAFLSGRPAQHICKVLKARPGDRLKVGVVNGNLGCGVVRETSRELAVLEISISEQPPPPSRLELILALPRPIMLNRVLSQAASLGIKRVYLIKANRVEKSFFSASALAPEAMEQRLRLGLEQAVDTVLPQVTVHHRFRPFMEDYLAEIGRNEATGLVAHPSAAATLAGRLSRVPGQGVILLAIGPEGGWVDFEMEIFESQGFSKFSLGPRILRVDTAVPALIAQVETLLTRQGNS